VPPTIHSFEGVPLTRLFAVFGTRPVIDDTFPGPDADPAFKRRHVPVRHVRWRRGDYYLDVTCFGNYGPGRWIVSTATEYRADYIHALQRKRARF
jgi:hypothetical protein